MTTKSNSFAPVDTPNESSFSGMLFGPCGHRQGNTLSLDLTIIPSVSISTFAWNEETLQSSNHLHDFLGPVQRMR